jgi:S-adenosylmethionine-diacylgycerolhomoserine-N-methlytransferase
MMNHAETLDRIYRYQRHIYDATRRFSLLGRDRLLDSMTISREDKILEIGCGTGRNLILLAQQHPNASFFGIDASGQMLATATRQIAVRGLAPRIALVIGLAERLDPKTMFGAPLEFDKIFFSYSLSMMPRWQEAVDAAFTHLKLTGTLHVLDFWDQESWPDPLKRIFARWLALFHVRFEPEVISTLSRHFTSRGQSLSLASIASRYAFLASPVPLSSCPFINSWPS